MIAVTEPTVAARLEALRTALAGAASRSPDAARTILHARARLLARRIAADDDAGEDALDLLLVLVGEEFLAIPVTNVVAIARSGTIAPLPRAVPPVYGVTAWRGRPITVLSLSAAPPAPTPESRIVVLGIGARAMLGVVVDAVVDTARTTHGALTPAGPGERRAYALGITPEGLLVVSGEALLHPETLSP